MLNRCKHNQYLPMVIVMLQGPSFKYISIFAIRFYNNKLVQLLLISIALSELVI